MPKVKEIDKTLRAVIDVFEHTDPVAYRKLITDVLQNENYRRVWKDKPVPHNEDLENFGRLYLQWKKHLRTHALPSKEAFKRDFFVSLVDLDKRKSYFIPYLPKDIDVQKLMDVLDDFSVEYFLGVVGSDDFANVFVVHLMSEVLFDFINIEFTEAMKLNDAGFNYHYPGGYEDALELHEKALELSPGFSLAWINKGIALKNLERYDEAIACYDEVINSIDPDYKKAWHNKGVALKQKGKLIEAIKCFDKAIELDPEYSIALQVRKVCLAELMLDNPELEEKVDSFTMQLQNNPQAIQLLIMANTFEERGDWKTAANLMKQVNNLIPNNPDVLVTLGNDLYESGLKDEAVEKFREVLEIDPKNGLGLLNMARYYLDQQEFKEALESSSKAIENVPNHSMAWANHSTALCGLRNYEEALTSAKRACELDEYNPFALNALGNALFCLDRKDEAKDVYEELLRKHPDFIGAQQIRRLISRLD